MHVINKKECKILSNKYIRVYITEAIKSNVVKLEDQKGN